MPHTRICVWSKRSLQSAEPLGEERWKGHDGLGNGHSKKIFARLGQAKDRPFSSLILLLASRNLLSESSCEMMDSFLESPSFISPSQQLLPFSSRSFTSNIFFLLLLLHLDMLPTRLSSFHQQQQQSAAEAKSRERSKRKKKFQLKLGLSHHSHLKWKDYQVEH